MTNNELLAYTPSGKVDISLLWKLLLMLSALALLVYLYSQLVIQLPRFYIATISSAVFIGILGKLAGWIVRWGKIRNLPFGFSLGFILGLCGCFFSWIFLLPVMLQSSSVSSLELFKNPLLIFEYIPQISTQSWYQVADWTLTDEMIRSIWGGEFLAMLIWPAISARKAVGSILFCEHCSQWAENQGQLLAFYYPDTKELTEGFSNGDFEFMDNAIPIFNSPIKDYFQIENHVCPGCNDFFALSLKLVEQASDIDKSKVKTLHDKLVVSRPYFQHFLMLKSRFPTPVK